MLKYYRNIQQTHLSAIRVGHDCLPVGFFVIDRIVEIVPIRNQGNKYNSVTFIILTNVINKYYHLFHFTKPGGHTKVKNKIIHRNNLDKNSEANGFCFCLKHKRYWVWVKGQLSSDNILV